MPQGSNGKSVCRRVRATFALGTPTPLLSLPVRIGLTACTSETADNLRVAGTVFTCKPIRDPSPRSFIECSPAFRASSVP